MRTFNVYVRRPVVDIDRDLVVVKEGFSWPAFFFSVLWALWHRLWLVALGFLGAQVLIGGVIAAAGFDMIAEAAVSLGLAAMIGAVANDLRRWSLGRDGYVEADVVAGTDPVSAERRFFDSHPATLAELAR